MYRLALSIVRDPALADDVVQETLIKAWRAAPLDADGSVPRAWMTKVARNTAISMLRTRARGSDRRGSSAGTRVAR